MNTLYDVMQLLKKYGVFVYTGQKQIDIDLMEDEIRELFHSTLISSEEFTKSLLILRREREKLS